MKWIPGSTPSIGIRSALRVLLLLLLLLVALDVPPTWAWTLRLPGGGRVTYNGGILRIRLDNASDLPGMPSAETTIDSAVLEALQVRDTHNPIKGFGAYCTRDLPKHTFLGFYEGIPRASLQGLKNTEYIMSLDGGQTYLDGYERAQDRSTFSPVHLNHADKPHYNCVQILEENRCAFFTARDIQAGEELTFDYGANYWRGREQEKV